MNIIKKYNPNLIENIQFHGRWDLSPERGYTTHWSGSSIYFQTTSRSVVIEIGPLTSARQNYHNILWKFGADSFVRTALVKGARSMWIMPSDSRGGEALRDVRIALADWGASLQILDIDVSEEDDRTISAPIIGSPTRPLLFIGGSLVCGYSPPYGGLVLPHGSYQAFPSIVARSLRARGIDARLEMVAVPGVRLMTTSRAPGMADLFFDGNDGVGGWEHRSREDPTDIFICLGTNDQGWGADTKEYVESYRSFLVRLRDSCSEMLRRIHVISPFGRFINPQDRRERIAVFEPEVQTMVKNLALTWKTGSPDDVRLYHVSTAGWINQNQTCDGVHPTSEGHETIAAKLIDYLESVENAEVEEEAEAAEPKQFEPTQAGFGYLYPEMGYPEVEPGFGYLPR
ncbi:hypothetical protein M422DRAFT_784673 [Sphaerobolus stellatus SS14]|uniref:SGNH hydrolase-type esterase domain-containing protein n=1 Tax=Sphaerobolus stellatus (strain SS14) TaxID=990650 RepID=A0A0C9URI8_SPHS4|nr:hypothetical protein M422DRAFT_784673 [Sphaerobolus stellatus SS14]